jgi:hypothetical protein
MIFQVAAEPHALDSVRHLGHTCTKPQAQPQGLQKPAPMFYSFQGKLRHHTGLRRYDVMSFSKMESLNFKVIVS